VPATPTVSLTISVVIPVKNDAAELERCLLALGVQTVPADEIIVVDNGSSDESTEVAERFGVRLVHESSPGIGAASARGYDAALGDVIARLDADCTPGANWVETIRTAFESRPDLDAITGSAQFSDGPPALRTLARWLYLGSYFWSMTLALGHVPLFGSNMAFRRSVWGEVRDGVHRYTP